MKVIYIHRNKKAGISIQKVFKTITSNLNSEISYENIYLPFYGANPIKILGNLFFIFRLRKKNTVYHITGDVYYAVISLIGLKTVVTYHDLAFIRNAKNKFDYHLKKIIWINLPLFFSKAITCISNKTGDELRKYSSRKDIKIIHNPLPDAFSLKDENFNEVCPIILHVGTDWNKNLSNVVMSLQGINCHLRIIGDIDDSIIQLLEENSVNFSVASNLTDKQIVSEYYRADVISFPSIYEGFGMPIIEGQSAGCPVITSNIEPMIEVAGDGACFVNPKSISEIKFAFLKIINDSEYRKDLISKGYTNSKRFDSKKITLKYTDIYRTL